MNEKVLPEWDQLSIETPELVTIDMPVAGLGSRFFALLVDYLIWAAFFLAIGIFFSVVHPSMAVFSKLGEKWSVALVTFGVFLFYWGYFTLFEAFWDGRTPGKRAAKIRVIQRTGQGIGLFEAMIRNLLRLIDQIPSIYVVGVISILVTRQQQRLGDLAAGTLVVHDRGKLTEAISSTRTFTSGLFETAPAAEKSIANPDLPVHALQQLGAADLEVLEAFLVRRLDFDLDTRARLAQRIADGIQHRSGLCPQTGISTETFLEQLARDLRDTARIR